MVDTPDKQTKKGPGRPAGMTKLQIHRKKLEAERKAELEAKKLEKAKQKLTEAESRLQKQKAEKNEVKEKISAVKKEIPVGSAKGRAKSEGSGRKPGSKNVIPRDLKEMIMTALSDVGGKDYLALQARKNPVAFLSLLGKIIPKDVSVSANGSRLDLTIEDKELTVEELKKELTDRGLPTTVFIDEQIDILMGKQTIDKVPANRH